MKKRFSISLAVLLATAILCGATPLWAQRGNWWGSSNRTDSADVRSAFRSVVASSNQSTVRVVCDGRDAALGTIVGADGWIITKYSELREPIACRLPDKRQLPAQVVGQDPHYDLAMLKIEATDLIPVNWSEDETGPAVGQLLATVSATGDLPRAIGVVSVPRRAIPPNARLGVRFDDDQSAAKIGQVIPGGAASRAGLQVGDIVERVDNTVIDNRDTMIDTIHELRPGDKITLLVRRGEDELKLSATLTSSLGADEVNRSDRMNQMGTTISKRAADFPPVIQHDSTINAAECGGPLVDLNGKVVGINIARGGRTESYAVPADRVRLLLFDMEHDKLTPKSPLPGYVAAKVDGKAVDGDAIAPTSAKTDGAVKGKPAASKAPTGNAAADSSAADNGAADSGAAKKTEPAKP